MIYYVAGSTENGENPVSFFPTVASFIGESGTFLAPEALAKNQKGCGAGKEFAGEEALGAMTFAEIMLAPGQAREYIVVSGMTESEEEIKCFINKGYINRNATNIFEDIGNFYNAYDLVELANIVDIEPNAIGEQYIDLIEELN